MIELKIELEGITPPIWRRVVVPASTPLNVLHMVIQGAMAWQDSHLHEFEIEGRRYEMGDIESDFRDPDEEFLDERLFRLEQVVKPGDSFVYTYDFGDNWRHLITVEAYELIEGSPDTIRPCCLDGERACPPEDCGGPFNYDEFLEALADPDREEHEDTKTWAGPFEPEVFSVVQAHAFVTAMYYMGMDQREPPENPSRLH